VAVASSRYERSREIGVALERARRREKKSIRQCAEFLGISRRRYTEIEKGAAFIAAVELEELVRFLRVPPHEVYPADLVEEYTRRLVVQAQPGESVQVVVNIAAAAEDKPGPIGE
jgi:transcriptional regulator with XRE-family HTH domain